MNDTLLGSDVGIQPDFSIFTAGMELDSMSPVERPVVHMVGSSTEQDLHKDTMTDSALSDMKNRAPNGLLIWLNHDYTLPKSLFGSLYDAPMLIQKGGVADLRISVEVELENPEAAQTYKYIQRGRRLGCSVGCQVEDYEIVDSGKKGEMPLVYITHVRPVEWSVVGIPANQRSWVENAINGLFERALRTGHEDEAVKLAPIAKSLFPRDYKHLAKSVTNASLRKELLEIPARPTPGQKILWEPESRKFFFVGGENGQIKREVERSQLVSVMDTINKALLPTALTEQSHVEPEAQTPVVEYPVIVRDADDTVHGHTQNTTGTQADMTVTVKLDEGDVAEMVKSILVKAKEESDAHDEKVAAQKERAAKYHIAPKEGGNLTKPGKWSSVPDEEWGDPVNYKYPMPDKSHADNAASRWGDDADREQYSSEEQAIISKRIAARQAHFGEGEKNKKSVDIIETKNLGDGSVLYTFSDGSQRLETVVHNDDGTVSLDALDIAADGTHAPMKGKHAHKHADGDGEMHNHAHSHDGDAAHDHAHDDEGPAEPVEPRGAGDDDADDEAKKGAETEVAPVEPMTAEVTPDAEVTKSAEVDGDGKPATEGDGEQGDGKEVLDVQKAATLAVYNQLGASLGLAPVTDVTKAAKADEGSNAKVASLVTTADDAIDELMRLLNIPDIDDKSAGDLTEKSGAEISARNKLRLKGAHDVLAEMASGVHCAAYCAANGDAAGAMNDEKAGDAELEAIVEEAVRKAFGGLDERLAALSEALGNIDVKAFESEVARTKKEFVLTRKSLEDMRVDAMMLKDTVDEVSNKGLGRPTRTFTTRQAPAEVAKGVGDAVNEPVAPKTDGPSEDEIAAARTLEEAMTLTRKEYVKGVGIVRVWPKGVAKGFRPDLSGEEMVAMSAQDILKYLDGDEVAVPVINH